MEKKIKAGRGPLTARVIYGVVIAILCITAIVVGIAAAANRKDGADEPKPPVSDGGGDNVTPEPKPEEPKEPEVSTPSFGSPVSAGSIGTEHSADMPVFSTTLGEWRTHSGIDVLTDEGAAVLASADGVISAVRRDPLLGYTVEITHADGYVTVYSNLKEGEAVAVKVGDEVEAGERIGTVGESAISEIAEEAHLHLEVFKDGVAIDPVSIFNDEARAVLGIGE